MNLFHPDTVTALFIVASIVIPAVSRALTPLHLDTFWVGVVSLLLASVNGFVSTWQADPHANHYDWQLGASASILSFLVAVIGGQHGLIKKTKLESTLARLGQKKKTASAPADWSVPTLAVPPLDIDLSSIPSASLPLTLSSGATAMPTTVQVTGGTGGVPAFTGNSAVIGGDDAAPGIAGAKPSA